MLVLGLLLLLVGALGILAGLLTASGTTELLGLDVDAVALFLVGVASGAAVLWGFWILKFGTKRSLQRRRESRRLSRRSEELERGQAESAGRHEGGTPTAGPSNGTPAPPDPGRVSRAPPGPRRRGRRPAPTSAGRRPRPAPSRCGRRATQDTSRAPLARAIAAPAAHGSGCRATRGRHREGRQVRGRLGLAVRPHQRGDHPERGADQQEQPQAGHDEQARRAPLRLRAASGSRRALHGGHGLGVHGDGREEREQPSRAGHPARRGRPDPVAGDR